MPSLFEKDIQYLKGVGEKRAKLFAKIGAPTVGDLLRLYPRAYEDWSQHSRFRHCLKSGGGGKGRRAAAAHGAPGEGGQAAVQDHRHRRGN